MISYDYLPVTFDELPVSKIFDMGTDYMFEFVYNTRIDRITMYIRDTEGVLLYSTRVTYGSKLYHAVVEGLELDHDLVAMNLDDVVSSRAIDDSGSVTDENFGSTVKIYLV